MSVASQTAPAGYEAFTDVYAFAPEALTFALPVRVSLDLCSGAANPQLFWSMAGSTTTFEELQSMVVGDTLVGSVTHFSRGFGGRALPVNKDGGASDDDAAAVGSDDAAAVTNDDAAAVVNPDAAIAGDPDAASGPSDSGVAECTALDPGNTPVTETVVHADFPNPMGGVIADGTWVMVERVRYDGPGGAMSPGQGTFFQSLRFTGTAYEQSFRLEGGGMTYFGELTANHVENGTTFVIDVLCPMVRTAMSPYTVTNNGRRFIQYAGATTGIASVYDLQ